MRKQTHLPTGFYLARDRHGELKWPIHSGQDYSTQCMQFVKGDRISTNNPTCKLCMEQLIRGEEFRKFMSKFRRTKLGQPLSLPTHDNATRLRRELTVANGTGVMPARLEVADGSQGKVTLLARDTYVRNTEGHNREQKGVRIECHLPAPKYGHRTTVYARYLPPGWSFDQFNRAAELVQLEARYERKRQIAVEKCYAVCEEIEPLIPERLKGKWSRDIGAEEKRSGHTCAYDAMTREGAEHWTRWMKSYLVNMREAIKPKRRITRDELCRLSQINASRMPKVVNDNGERKRWVGIGWVTEGPADGTEQALVTDPKTEWKRKVRK